MTVLVVPFDGPLSSFGIFLVAALGAVICAVYFVWQSKRLRKALENNRRMLDESAAHSRVILGALKDGVVVFDRDQILEVNDALCRMTGYAPSELISRDFVDRLVAPESRLAIRNAAHEQSIELILLRNDQSPFPVEVRKKPTVYNGSAAELAVIRDLSERKGTEQARRESEEMFKLVVDSAPNALIMTNERGEIVLVNSQAQRLFNYGRDEMVGKPVEMLIPSEVREAHVTERERYYQELSARPMGAGRDLYGVRSDGQKVAVEIGLNPIHTKNGILVLASVVDISQRKRAEEALKDAARKKDEFLAMLAHELRNPMAAISAAANLLSIPALGEEQANMARASLKRRVHQLSRLVDDLLDVSRIIRGRVQLHQEELDLSAPINAAIETTRAFVDERKHTLKLEITNPLPIRGDAVRLEQVITNLLVNAAKYTDPGGQIWVTAFKEGENAVIKVKDNGVGIPEDMLSGIFELFGQVDTSLHRSHGGLGIGLSVAKKLTEMHGGTISASSEGVGKGSEFMVRLPLAYQQNTAEQKDAEALVRPGLRILIVEDHRDTASMEAADLQLRGHATEVAYDGLSGLQRALETRPDVILLDIGLPGLNGFEVAKKLRESGLSRTLIIAVTGYGQEQDYEQSRQAGIDFHVLKPLDYSKIARFFAQYQEVASVH